MVARRGELDGLVGCRIAGVGQVVQGGVPRVWYPGPCTPPGLPCPVYTTSYPALYYPAPAVHAGIPG